MNGNYEYSEDYDEVPEDVLRDERQDDYEDDEVLNSIQFSTRIMEPGIRDIVKKIRPVLSDEAFKEVLNKAELMFSPVTRDYNLANLDKPKKRNTFYFATFAHTVIETCLSKGYYLEGLFMASVLAGTLNQSRAIDFMQQNVFNPNKREVRRQYDYPDSKSKKGNLKNAFRRW